jgi:hypothetical protein
MAAGVSNALWQSGLARALLDRLGLRVELPPNRCHVGGRQITIADLIKDPLSCSRTVVAIAAASLSRRVSRCASRLAISCPQP